MELHAHLLHVGNADRGQIAVQHGQHVIHGLHHGDLRTEGCIGAGQLQTNDTAADDHHALRQLLKAQCPGGVDAVGIFLQAGDGRRGVDGAGGDDDGVRRHLLAGAVRLLHRQLFGAGERGLAVDNGDFIHLQQALDAAGELFGNVVLMGNDLREIHLDPGDLHADVLTLIPDVLHQFGGVQQALGGDAADIQAGAAQMLLFDQGDFRAQLSRPDGGHIAAGAAADDNDLHTRFSSQARIISGWRM